MSIPRDFSLPEPKTQGSQSPKKRTRASIAPQDQEQIEKENRSSEASRTSFEELKQEAPPTKSLNSRKITLGDLVEPGVKSTIQRIPKDDELSQLTRKTFVEPKILEIRANLIDKLASKDDKSIDKKIDHFIEDAKKKKKKYTSKLEEKSYASLKKQGITPETPLKQSVQLEIDNFSTVFLNKTNIKEEIHQKAKSPPESKPRVGDEKEQRIDALGNLQTFLSQRKRVLEKELEDKERIVSEKGDRAEIQSLKSALRYIEIALDKATSELSFFLRT